MAADHDPHLQLPGLALWSEINNTLAIAEKSRQEVLDNPRAQAQLLYSIGHPDHGYWQLNEQHQREVEDRMCRLVPRLINAAKKRETLRELFALYHGAREPYEDLTRAVKVSDFQPRPLWAGEELYPTTGWLGSAIHWCRESEVPLGYYFWSFVTALGASCRYAWYIDRNTDILRLNYYTFMIGKKATGKTTAMLAAKEVLERLNRQVRPWTPGRPLPDYKATYPHQVRFQSEDVTPQALCESMAFQERVQYSLPEDPRTYFAEIPSAGAMFLDELAIFLGRDQFAIATRVPLLTRLFGGADFDYETKSGGKVSLRKLALTILGCSTPEWLRDSLSPLMFTGGFMDRVHIVYREPILARLYPTPRPRDPVMGNHLARWLRPFLQRTKPEEITATKQGMEWYEEWYRTYPEPDDEIMPTVKRRANLLWKTAAVVALSRTGSPFIHPEDFETVSRILIHEYEGFQTFMGRVDRPPELDHMEYIERSLWRVGAHGSSALTRSELYNMMRQRKGLSPPSVKAVPFIQSLLAAGRIEAVEMKSSTGSKTGLGYRLTPFAVREMRARLSLTQQDAEPILQAGEDGGDA